MRGFLSDVLFAWRLVVKTPWMSAAAVVSLAGAMAVTIGGFSLLWDTMFAELPFAGGDRIVTIRVVDQRRSGNAPSVAVYREWVANQRTFAVIGAAYSRRREMADGSGGFTRYSVSSMTASGFGLAGVQPILGRTLSAADEVPGSRPVAVIGHRAWTTIFGSDPAVVGRTITLDGEARLIVGVMPDGFRFPISEDLWIPFRTDGASVGAVEPRWMHVFGRLAPGVTASAAEADLETIRAGYGALHPEDVELQERRTSIVPYVQSDSEPGATLIVEGMFAFVVLVLVVACASVANLLLCRTMARRGEIAMRAAMGASRSRLVTQLFLEALLLTATAAAAGVGIAGLGLRWFKSNIPIENLPFWVSFGLDMPTALFTTAAALVAAALAGIAPALRATSGALQDVLKDQQRAMSGVRFGSVSGMLTVIEVTLAVAFLAAAGLAARSVLDATGTTAALPSREILVAEVQLAQEYSIGPDGTTTVPERSIPIAQWPAVAEDIRMAVAGLPGVRAVALATSLPVYQHAGGRIEIDGATGSGSAVDVRVIRTAVTPELLEVFGGRLLAGRFLTHADQRVSEPVAVVNRHLAERFFAGENPLGRRFRERTPGLHPWVTIVGVVDGLPMNPAGDRQPGYYRPLAQQTGPEFRMAARVDSAPTSLSAAVRDRVTRLDERITVADFKTHEDAAGSLLVAYRMVSLVFVGLGGTALFLAVAGLYAVMSFSVTQRTREIGIRVALGASAARVTATVLQRGLRQIAIGLVLGSAGGWALMRLLSYIPSGMSGAAPSLLVLAACTMLASGVCACLVPMVRTLRIHPVDALRQD